MVLKIDIGDLAAMEIIGDLSGWGVKTIIETWWLGIGPPAAKSPLPHI